MLLLHLLGIFFKVEWSALALALALTPVFLTPLVLTPLVLTVAAARLLLVSKTTLVVLATRRVAATPLNTRFVEAKTRRTLVNSRDVQGADAFPPVPDLAHSLTGRFVGELRL